MGDTITHLDRPCEAAIDGFEEVKPMVFAGVYPIETEDLKICAHRSKNFSSMMRRSRSPPSRLPLSGSDSAAVSSVCCIWR